MWKRGKEFCTPGTGCAFVRQRHSAEQNKFGPRLELRSPDWSAEASLTEEPSSHLQSVHIFNAPNTSGDEHEAAHRLQMKSYLPLIVMSDFSLPTDGQLTMWCDGISQLVWGEHGNSIALIRQAALCSLANVWHVFPFPPRNTHAS